MIAAVIFAHSLHEAHVAGVLDDAQRLGAALRACADFTYLVLGIAAADGTEMDALLGLDKRIRKRFHILIGHGDNMVRKALRTLDADARKPVEACDKLFYALHIRSRSRQGRQDRPCRR